MKICELLVWLYEKLADRGNAVPFLAVRVFDVQLKMCIMGNSVLLLAFKLTGFLF